MLGPWVGRRSRSGTLGAVNSGPVVPGPSAWELPDPAEATQELVGVGADLEPGTLLYAYQRGLFPMRLEPHGPLGWWSPDPRGVIPIGHWRAARSVRRSTRRFDVTVDEFIAAYARLHALGWAHSVEVWGPPGDETPMLVGGLYGVAIGGLFAGESMFHRARDASKVALLDLVGRLQAGGGALLDVQWCTPHLATLGAAEIPRVHYLDLLADAVNRPQLLLR